MIEIFLGSKTDCIGSEWKRCLSVKHHVACSCTQIGGGILVPYILVIIINRFVSVFTGLFSVLSGKNTNVKIFDDDLVAQIGTNLYVVVYIFL